jgi:hypothetical protein
MKKTPVLAGLSVVALALAALFAVVRSPAARAQSGSFQIALHGHSVGVASYRVTGTSQGYNSTSLVRVTMKGLNYDMSKSERLTSASHLVHVQLSATVNGSAATATALPEGGHIVLSMSANGRKVSTNLPSHEGAVLLPDFDPGALETLLVLAVQQNNRDLWAIIPKNSGSIVPVQLATLADMRGTLNSQPVTVHHLEATIGGAKTELFSGPENQLLQAELPQDGFALVRNGFVLQPPSRAPAPPAQPQTAPGQAAPGQAPPQ